MGQNYGEKEDDSKLAKWVFGLIGALAFLGGVIGIGLYLNQPTHSSKPAVHAPAPSNAS